MLPAQPNQSLIDGLSCLQALASAGKPVGSRQMARELKLEATRVNRLLKTLAHLGIAQQTPDKQYIPGPAMHVLAAQAMFGSGLLHRALEPLESLRRFKLAVAMGVLWRDHVSYLYHGGPGTKAAGHLVEILRRDLAHGAVELEFLDRSQYERFLTLQRREGALRRWIAELRHVVQRKRGEHAVEGRRRQTGGADGDAQQDEVFRRRPARQQDGRRRRCQRGEHEKLDHLAFEGKARGDSRRCRDKRAKHRVFPPHTRTAATTRATNS
jgi:DNA-binding IclR family transcriptional regulator